MRAIIPSPQFGSTLKPSVPAAFTVLLTRLPASDGMGKDAGGTVLQRVGESAIVLVTLCSLARGCCTMISVEADGEGAFTVVVDGPPRTTHRVTLEPEYYRHLTGGGISPQALVRNSFEFLLAREPNTSILARFDLRLISRYFPEFESMITASAKR